MDIKSFYLLKIKGIPQFIKCLPLLSWMVLLCSKNRQKVIEQYKEDVIVLTGNLYGEVPSKILNVGEAQAEEALLWWKEQFGEDLYIELMRHGQEDERVVNETLLSFSKSMILKLLLRTILLLR